MRERLAAVASARAAGSRASGGRPHVLARLAAVVMSFVVTLNIATPVASARVFDNLDNIPVVVWAQYDSGEDVEHGFVGNCYNEFTAALTALGHSRSQLTAEMETKLSNASTGGRFYEFSQSLSTGYTDIDSLPGWTPTLIAGYIWSASVIGGNDTWRSLWSWSVSKDLFDGAKEDLQTVMRGGSLGGGGSVTGQYVLIPKFVYNSTKSTVTDGTVTYGTDLKSYNVDTVASNMYPALNLTCSYPSDYFENLPVNVDDYDLITGLHTWSTSSATLTAILVKPGKYTVQYGTYVDTAGRLGTAGAEYDYVESVSVTEVGYYVSGLPMSYSLNGTNIEIGYRGNEAPSNSSWIRLNAGGSRNLSNSYQLVSVGETGGDGGGGTNNWPDDDEGGGSDDEPREPEVPDPDPTPVPDPDPIDQPTWPQPDPIDNPVGGGGTTINYSPPTDTTVIENWLAVIYKAIVDGFNAVTDDMETHCKHIQSKLNTVYENLVSMIGKYISAQTESINNNISNQVWWLARQIDGQFDELKDYMHDLAEWLADQLDFEVNVEGDGYDDTSIVSWLKKIYAKLGNGGANSRPVDPVVNDDDWWEWLLRALQNWTAGLILNANDLVSNLGDLLSRLISRFPFGIPFMTLDVITLLAADPVTPEFDLSYQVYQTQVSYNVDLEPFNDAAATVRAMEYLIFGGYLLMKTPKVISEMMGVFE